MNKDSGLQLERTQLAWVRTLFLLALVGIFILRIGLIEQSMLLCFAGIVLLILLIVVKLYQYYYPNYFATQGMRKPNKLLSAITLTILVSSLLVITHYTLSPSILIGLQTQNFW